MIVSPLKLRYSASTRRHLEKLTVSVTEYK